MATALKVPEANVKSLLKQADLKVSKDADESEIVKKLKVLVKRAEEDEEGLDINAKSQKLLDKISEAMEEKRKVKIVSADDDDDEDEEEEAPKKKKGGKKAAKASENGKAAKKKGGKKGGGKSRGTGGPTTKDKVFELWIDDPANAVKKAIKKFGSGGNEGAQDTTIRRWISRWRRAKSFECKDGFPRAGAGRKKEILAAQKASKKSKKDDE